MASACPPPQHLPYPMVGFAKGLTGFAVSVIVRPTLDDGAEVTYGLSCGSLFVVVQVSLDASKVLQHLVLGGLGEQCLFEAMYREPQKVTPCREAEALF